MTPKDAAAKWCPFARHWQAAAAYNRPQDEKVNCIGASCMAWRWRHGRPAKGVGFCGLVGDPAPVDIIEQRLPPLGPNGLPRAPKDIDHG